MTGKDGGWVLPDNLHPPTVCFQIEVPNDRQYIAAFMGALWELQYWFNWRRDPARTALEVSDVWRPLLENIKYCDGTPVNTGYAGAGGGDDDPMIRQNPDNPCELQNSVNGVDWCTWADLSLCVNGGQPGTDAEQPEPGGGEACYSGKLQANGQFLIPTVVSTGDVVSATSLLGAGHDGGSNWYCPDGSVFFAGFCTGLKHVDPTDPAPALSHMAVVLHVGSTYYDLSAGPVTIGASILNQQATVQVNDATLTDNSGEYTLTVCVTNNAQPAWCHFDNMQLTNGNYFHGPTPAEPAGVWVGGSGWEDSDASQPSGTHWRGVHVQYIPPAAMKVDQIDINMDYTQGIGLGGLDAVEVSLWQGGTQTYVIVTTSAGQANGTSINLTATPHMTGVTRIQIAIHTDQDAASYGGFSGSCRLNSVKVQGEGYNPYGDSNC